MMKCGKWPIRLLCVLLSALFCACTPQTVEMPDMALTETMPKAKDEREHPYFETELFWAAEDNRSLKPELRRIIMTEDAGHVEMALRALFAGASTQSQKSILQGGVYFEGLELSTEVCNVYLAGDVTLDEKQWLITRAAVAATVNAVDGTSNVNLYYNGMEPGYIERPLGSLSPIVENLDVYVRNLELEYEALKKEREENAVDNSFEMRNTTLYFTDAAGKLFITQNNIVSYAAKTTVEEIAEIIITALKKPIESTVEIRSALPEDFSIVSLRYIPDASAVQLEDKAETTQSDLPDTGIIELVFKKPRGAYDGERMCGAITLALTGFIPKLRGVSIIMEDEYGQHRDLNRGSICRREMYSGLIGHTICLHYPEEDGEGFYTALYTVAGDDSFAPAARLRALLNNAETAGTLFPGIDGRDIEDVYITGDTAVVNWKAGFAKKLKALQEDEDCTLPKERRIWLFVYSVINTMTEFPGVHRVWMLEDGKKLGTQGEVYLGNALLRNPGIVSEAE